MAGRPLSPDSFQTFGDLLKYLRRRERLTQLELSIAVGYSDAQITRLEKNQRRPELAVLKALFIPALHIENEPELITRFLELARSAGQEESPAPGFPPYKGLLFFDEVDSNLFFGREALTAHLEDRVAELVMDSSAHFLAVVGASGSGKSSLVRAGLAVARKHAGWDVRIFTPGADPLKALERQLEGEQVHSASDSLLILVDQFEEVFTLCRDETERIAFIERLLALAQYSSKAITVVIALRADFYSHCAHYPLLRRAVAAEQEYIGQMTIEELRRAIEEPARRGGWEFEPGLVDMLLQDIGAHGAHEPEAGALPLLSHALLATWERRRGRMLTLDGYHASGGVRGAIAETAESVFTDQLNQTQQELARDVFLRLTELGEGTEDTRRRAALNELVRQSTETAELRAVLNTLAEARLITLDEDSAEVAHEALIREWQRLREWLTQDREGLFLHRHLTETAHEWERRGRDPSELYRGARLAQTREWASAHQDEMNELESEFLSASMEASEHEARLLEEQHRRELDAAHKLTESERQRADAESQQVEQQIHTSKQLRKRAIYLSAALTLAMIAALSAALFGYRANTSFTHSEAERLAAEANSLMLTQGDTNLIALLTIRSLNMDYTPTGDALLADVTTLELPPRELQGHTADVWGADFSPDGKYLVTGSSDRTARLWDLATGETIRVFSRSRGSLEAVAFSPDGKYIVTANLPDKTASLWDVSSGQEMQVFSGHTAAVGEVKFLPDGKYIVTTSDDLTVRIWDVATGETLHILTGHNNGITRMAVSPNGKYVVTGSLDRTARLWDGSTGKQVRVIAHPEVVSAVAYSPDGKYFATGCEDKVTRLWDATTGQIVREFLGGEVLGIEFSPDGRFLLTGGSDRTALLWDLATGETIRSFTGHTSSIQTVTFSPDGHQIVTTSNDRIVRVWSLQSASMGTQFIGHKEFVFQASFSPDGEYIVTASIDNSARIWNTLTGQTIITLIGHTNEVRSAVFSPDGRTVLTASADGTARLWEVASGKELLRLEGHTDAVNQVAFSPDGQYIVTASWDGTARVWDPRTGETKVIYTNQGPGRVNRAVFSPDGKTVATTGDDGTARIWDPSSGKDLTIFKGHTDRVTGVAFSPDGKYLVTCSFDGSVRLWEVSSGKEIRRFAGHRNGSFRAAFSPDGKFVLTSSGRDETARLWDVRTGREVRRFSGPITSATFSPDGKYILTGSEDGTARLWLLDLQDTIRGVCATLTRDLTPEERTQFGILDQGPTCSN